MQNRWQPCSLVASGNKRRTQDGGKTVNVVIIDRASRKSYSAAL